MQAVYPSIATKKKKKKMIVAIKSQGEALRRELGPAASLYIYTHTHDSGADEVLACRATARLANTCVGDACGWLRDTDWSVYTAKLRLNGICCIHGHTHCRTPPPAAASAGPL